jgi:integrative and conjugative element protein (TIGR02256 family)
MSLDKNENSYYFYLESESTLKISETAIHQLKLFQQKKRIDKEAGGILLGYQYENSADISIEEISTPFPNDQRSRSRFYRSIEHHHYAVKRWQETNHECLYLGLWHTHPEPIPTPSTVDYNDWQTALNSGQFERNDLFFIIVGLEEIRCWQGAAGSTWNRLKRKQKRFKMLERKYE